MSWIPDDLQSRLVMVLLHFVWQGFAVTLLLAVAVNVLGIRRPAARYAADLLAFALLIVCPVVTWTTLPGDVREGSSHNGNSPEFMESQTNSVVTSDLVSGINAEASDRRTSAPPSTDSSTETRLAVLTATRADLVSRHWISKWEAIIRPWELSILWMWSVGVLILSLRLVIGSYAIWNWRRGSLPVPSVLQATIDELCAMMRISRPIVGLCHQVTEAMATGLVRPMVLIPVSWITELPPDILRAVIAHELAHIRRWDLWVNLCQGLVETLFFYHPAVWWLSRQLRLDRELCCDELAVSVAVNNVRYAEMLEHVGRLQTTAARNALVTAVGGSDRTLFHRVQRVLQPSPRGDLNSYSILISVLLAVSLVSIASVAIRSSELVSPVATSPPEPQSLVESTAKIRLPGGQSVEFVGVTRNTASAKSGWRPNGSPIDNAGYWPSTIVLHGQNSSSSYVENGPHPEPDDNAFDLLMRFTGLKEQPSITFDMPAAGTSWHHRPLQDPYELRISLRRRVGDAKEPKLAPIGTFRVGVTDEPWGKWIEVRKDGTVANPLQDIDLYRSFYRQVSVVGVQQYERSPDKLALVMRRPQNASLRYAFEIRGVSAAGKSIWVVEWEGKDDSVAKTHEAYWGPGTSDEGLIDHYEYRLRPYRHWVTYHDVSFEAGNLSQVKASVESLNEPNETTGLTTNGDSKSGGTDHSRTVAQLRFGREIELVGVGYAKLQTPDGANRKYEGWWRPNGSLSDSEPPDLAPLSVVPGGHHFREFVFQTRMLRDGLKPGESQHFPLVLHGGLWFGTHQGRPLRAAQWNGGGFMQHQFIVGFNDESKTGSLSFYYSDQYTVNGGYMDLSGKIRPADDASADTKKLLNNLYLDVIERSPEKTIVKFKPNGLVRGRLQLHVIAIRIDGSRVSPVDPWDYERLVFKVPGNEVEAIQLNVCPMSHRVDCEDIAIVPGQKCNPKITVTPLDELLSITFGQGGRTLGMLDEIRQQDFRGILKALMADLNSETGELNVGVRQPKTREFAESTVKELKSDSGKWPTVRIENN